MTEPFHPDGQQRLEQAVLNRHVRAGVLLDLLMGFVQRSFFRWILRGLQGSLGDQATVMFDLVGRGMANPDRGAADEMAAPMTAQTDGQKAMEAIVLTDELLINRGRVRLCFRHPTDRELVVKVAAGAEKAQLAANLKEYRGYRDLIRKHGRLSCISHCHGFVATDRGQGLVCDCIRDEDGTISETIYDIIVNRDDADLELIVTVAEGFCGYLRKHDIRLFDLNPKNIALSRKRNGDYRPVALDLKGRYDNNEFVPFSSYIGFFARRKMARRSRQLLERIVFFHANRQRYRSARTVPRFSL